MTPEEMNQLEQRRLAAMTHTERAEHERIVAELNAMPHRCTGVRAYSMTTGLRVDGDQRERKPSAERLRQSMENAAAQISRMYQPPHIARRHAEIEEQRVRDEYLASQGLARSPYGGIVSVNDLREMDQVRLHAHMAREVQKHFPRAVDIKVNVTGERTIDVSFTVRGEVDVKEIEFDVSPGFFKDEIDAFPARGDELDTPPSLAQPRRASWGDPVAEIEQLADSIAERSRGKKVTHFVYGGESYPLTRQGFIDASMRSPYTSQDMERLVNAGGCLLDDQHTSALARDVEIHNQIIPKADETDAEFAARVLQSVGGRQTTPDWSDAANCDPIRDLEELVGDATGGKIIMGREAHAMFRSSTNAMVNGEFRASTGPMIHDDVKINGHWFQVIRLSLFSTRNDVRFEPTKDAQPGPDDLIECTDCNLSYYCRHGCPGCGAAHRNAPEWGDNPKRELKWLCDDYKDATGREVREIVFGQAAWDSYHDAVGFDWNPAREYVSLCILAGGVTLKLDPELDGLQLIPAA